MQAPFFPIIYVRGYAMTEGERDETAADPFCGFNLGSTVYRSAIDRKAPARKFVFESPLVRLAGDFGYADVYENGHNVDEPDWRPKAGAARPGIPARSVVVYRYYDAGSSLLGDGQASPIETYAKGLSDLILKVRERVCEHEGIAPADFRCYLVAHSMGGLVVRAFLQNPALGAKEARRAVDKFFTYATPHNGIELAGVNVPAWLSASEMNTFNRERMAGYLKLEQALADYGRVDYLPESALPLERAFCMVGTNRMDYQAGVGLSRTFAGHGSDGLVKVANAGLWGLDAKGRVTGTAATAYCYRAHSGFFGIVNSEEAYQNLVRFLFGDVRVEIWIEVDGVSLPPKLEGQDVQALYQFELKAKARGKRWYLSRRVAEEDSPACRTHAQLNAKDGSGSNLVYLSTVFLANAARVNASDPTLSYAMELSVRVPDYEVDKRFWPNEHYEGSALFSDQLVLVMTPPDAAGGRWQLRHGWASRGTHSADTTEASEVTADASFEQLAGGAMRIAIDMPAPARPPGITGRVVLVASAWNHERTPARATPET